MSHAGLTKDPSDLHNLHTPDPRTQRPPTIPERLEALEKNQARLEHAIMTSIRDLAISVNQMHQLQMQVLQNGGHTHDHAAPEKPSIVFTFLEALSDNTMYRVYQDGPDHPICPNTLNVHTRREGTDLFDSLPIEQPLLDLIGSEFGSQIGQVPNKVFFVEVHRLTNEPLDDTSVAVSQ